MRDILKYFHSSFIFTVVVAAAVFFFVGGWQALLTTMLLSVLEVSLSFDNAVVNATVIKDMDEKWRHRFITWGMAIAVFGMRMVFPLLIVSIIAGIAPTQNPLHLLTIPFPDLVNTSIFGYHIFADIGQNALSMALFDADKYAETLTSSHLQVAAFGGAFLMMVFWKFFVDEEKDHHWVSIIEAPLTKIGKIDAVQVGLTIGVMFVITKFLATEELLAFWVSGLAGIVTYIIADGFGALMEESEQHLHDGTVQMAKSGFALFMYLEVLDASFSFDGVIGAFALTNNIFIIAAGLGIGAMFVRSLTLMLVDKGTLDEFAYLEHSAFWAIGVLAATMFIGTFMHIPEAVIGLSSAAIIGLGLIHSIIAKKNEDPVDIAEEGQATGPL